MNKKRIYEVDTHQFVDLGSISGIEFFYDTRSSDDALGRLVIYLHSGIMEDKFADEYHYMELVKAWKGYMDG